MKKANQGFQKFARLIDNYELEEATIFLADRVFKQKDQDKSELWRDELRRALSRIKMTMDSSDEAVALLSLPWYAGRKDEFGRTEVDFGRLAVAPTQRWRGRPNFADAAYWNVWWDDFFSFNGYFCKKFEDVNCEFDDVWPVMETFVLARETAARETLGKLVARLEDEASKAAQNAASVATAAAVALAAGIDIDQHSTAPNSWPPTSPPPGHSASSFRNPSGGEGGGGGGGGGEDTEELGGKKKKKNLAKKTSFSVGMEDGGGGGGGAGEEGEGQEGEEGGGGLDASLEALQAAAEGADPTTTWGSRAISVALQAELDLEKKRLLLLEKEPSRSALVLGCGLSTTPLQLYQRGFTRVVCIDVSPKVVQNLTERYKEYPGIEVIECDARNLDRFREASFDLVVDKGLIDVLYTGWVGFKDVDLVCESVCRVLCPGACFVSVCCAPPTLRRAHFEESSTHHTEHRFHPWNILAMRGPPGKGDAGGLWVYVMTRLQPGESNERGDVLTGHDTQELKDAVTRGKDLAAKETQARHEAEAREAQEALAAATEQRIIRERREKVVAAKLAADDCLEQAEATVDPIERDELTRKWEALDETARRLKEEEDDAAALAVIEEQKAAAEERKKKRRRRRRRKERKAMEMRTGVKIPPSSTSPEEEEEENDDDDDEEEDDDDEDDSDDEDQKKSSNHNGLGTAPKIKEGKKLLQRGYLPTDKSEAESSLLGRKPGYMDLQVVRDHWVVHVKSAAPRVQQRPPTPTAEEFIASSKTPEEALHAQLEKKIAIETGKLLKANKGQEEEAPDRSRPGTSPAKSGGSRSGSGASKSATAGSGGAKGEDGDDGPPPPTPLPLIESEVGWERKAEALRRAEADNRAVRGGSPAGKGYFSEALMAQKAADENARRDLFSLDPVKAMARRTVKRLVKEAGGGEDEDEDEDEEPTASKEGRQDVNALIAELVKGQRELTRLRLERPPQPLEPRGDAKPVTILEHERAKRAKEDAELRAHRLKMGLDENDLTRPPEKWTPAMLSFVEFTPYGPRPPAEEVWEALTDETELTDICKRVVQDPACHRQLQQWCDGKSKVYKFFLTRALEATEDKAPVQLLKQALNRALGKYRPVDDDLIAAAELGPGAALHQQRKKKKQPKGRGRGKGGGGGDNDDDSNTADSSSQSQAGKGGGGNDVKAERSAAAEAKANRMKALRLMEEKLRKGKNFDDDDDDLFRGPDGDLGDDDDA